MMRKLLALALLVCLAPVAKSQDMPLSQILIDGEGWKKVEKPQPPPGGVPVVARSHNGHTTFRWIATSGRFIEARPAGVADSVPYSPYCPLRLRRGEKEIEVTGLAVDKDGRIYAATEIGVQVFDPTGRLCGVLTPVAEGKPTHLAFEGDQLTLWIGDTKYTRKLNTTGAK
jgi:enterochelin esterase family protein